MKGTKASLAEIQFYIYISFCPFPHLCANCIEDCKLHMYTK